MATTFGLLDTQWNEKRDHGANVRAIYLIPCRPHNANNEVVIEMIFAVIYIEYCSCIFDGFKTQWNEHFCAFVIYRPPFRLYAIVYFCAYSLRLLSILWIKLWRCIIYIRENMGERIIQWKQQQTKKSTATITAIAATITAIAATNHENSHFTFTTMYMLLQTRLRKTIEYSGIRRATCKMLVHMENWSLCKCKTTMPLHGKYASNKSSTSSSVWAMCFSFSGMNFLTSFGPQKYRIKIRYNIA